MNVDAKYTKGLKAFALAALVGAACASATAAEIDLAGNWNLVKVTRRGTYAADERVAAELTEAGFGLCVR